MALLHALCAVWPTEQIAVAHVNHLLRPTAADEAQFVRQTAVSHHLPFFHTEVDVAAEAAAKGQSLEEAGRAVRYRFLAEVALRVGATAVAVGHNADDQAETVLMNLLRGSGLTGLRGMQPIGPLPAAPALKLIRPLLAVSRDDIEAYCQAHRLQPRIDASNRDTAFLRNRIRHELMPLLESYNPQIKTRLQQMAAILDADVALLDEETEAAWHTILHKQKSGWLQLDRAGWQQLPLSLRRAVLRRAVTMLRPAQGDIGFESIEQARRLAEAPRSGQQATLPGGLTLLVENEWLTITAVGDDLPTDLPQLPAQTPLTLPIPGTVTLANGWQLSAEILDQPNHTHIVQNDDPWQAFIATSAASLLVRGRQRGERFQPLGMAGQSKAVTDVMIDHKLPAHLRHRWPIVAAEQHLLWIVGQHSDERVRVTKTTPRVVHLHCTKHSNAK